MTPPPFDQRAARLKTRLSALFRTPISLVITDNTRSIISARRKGYAFNIRLHHMFLEADEGILKALTGYLAGKREGHRRKLRAFIGKHEEKIRKPVEPVRPRTFIIRPKGRFFNLNDVFDRLNKRDFQGGVDCAITWGYKRKRRGRERVRLGSYSRKTQIIRISPILDRSFVPLYVIEDVVNHEMLHCHLGTVRRKGRNHTHHETFKKMEKAFPSHEKARHWFKKNSHRLFGP